MVDYVQANLPADMDNLAISGISYGAGISLLGPAREPRIKTAAALSGWGSLVDELYYRESPTGVHQAADRHGADYRQGRAGAVPDQQDLLNPETTGPGQRNHGVGIGSFTFVRGQCAERPPRTGIPEQELPGRHVHPEFEHEAVRPVARPGNACC